jgi:hypothetical protein
MWLAGVIFEMTLMMMTQLFASAGEKALSATRDVSPRPTLHSDR